MSSSSGQIDSGQTEVRGGQTEVRQWRDRGQTSVVHNTYQLNRELDRHRKVRFDRAGK